MAMCNDNVKAASRQFQFKGKFISAEPYGSGHINDNYRVIFDEDGVPTNYILQRINHNIFCAPAKLMENIQRVTNHLESSVRDESDSVRRSLRLIPTHNGESFHLNSDGNYWRPYLFISNATTYDAVESPSQAFQASRAFGQFQAMLASLPAPRLHETIPDFHNTPKRFDALVEAIEDDLAGRASAAKAEIEFALGHGSIAGILMDASLPERVTHNDTKLNNVMLDDVTGEDICVIDLDTVMPGLALYDFGIWCEPLRAP